MNRLVEINELPRQHGFPVGNYTMRYSTINQTVQGAKFVDGETVEPITGRVLHRLRAAYGSKCQIEPADDETILMVAAYLETRGKTKRAAEVLALADHDPRMVELHEHLAEATDDEEGLAALRDIAQVLGIEVYDSPWSFAPLKAAILVAGAAKIEELDADDAAEKTRVEEEVAKAAAEKAELEAKVAAAKQAAEDEVAAKAKSAELAAIADSAAKQKVLDDVKAAEAAEIKAKADADAAEERRLEAVKAEAALKASDEAREAAAKEAAAEPEANVADAVASVEPVIDDDIDGIEEEEVLRAIAAGLEVNTDGLDLPQIRAAIRKAREAG